MRAQQTMKRGLLGATLAMVRPATGNAWRCARGRRGHKSTAGHDRKNYRREARRSNARPGEESIDCHLSIVEWGIRFRLVIEGRVCD